MDTKLNPDPRGCYHRALPDEPRFALLARDPCAPDTIRFWADQRAQLGVEQEIDQDAEQLSEALETADAMERWREANEGAWRKRVPTEADPPTPTDETSSTAAKVLGMHDPFDSRSRIRQFSQLLADQGIGRIVRNGDGPTDDVIAEALSQVFGDLWEDARSLAGFVMNADPKAGPNG